MEFLDSSNFCTGVFVTLTGATNHSLAIALSHLNERIKFVLAIKYIFTQKRTKFFGRVSFSFCHREKSAAFPSYCSRLPRSHANLSLSFVRKFLRCSETLCVTRMAKNRKKGTTRGLAKAPQISRFFAGFH